MLISGGKGFQKPGHSVAFLRGGNIAQPVIAYAKLYKGDIIVAIGEYKRA